MMERKLTISHVTYARCANGYRHPDDLLAGLTDDLMGDITVEIDMGGDRKEVYRYSCDEDQWEDEAGNIFNIEE